MQAKKSQPAFSDTKKLGYSIVVPMVNYGHPAVYKVFFGSKYFIWKGKSLMQSCEILAKSISAGISKMNRQIPIPETDYLYHVLKHIRSSRCASARIEVIDDSFRDGEGVIDGVGVLKLEQRLLDEADGDIKCLNNNQQAYIPVNNIWITQPMKNKFLKWYKERREP